MKKLTEQEEYYRALNVARIVKETNRARLKENCKEHCKETGVTLGVILLILFAVAFLTSIVVVICDMWLLHSKGWTVNKAMYAIEQAHQPCQHSDRTVIYFGDALTVTNGGGK